MTFNIAAYKEKWEKPLLRFIAKGNTYPHRNILSSWAWYWDEERCVWVNENEVSGDDCCIQIIANLPGIEVTCEGPIE